MTNEDKAEKYVMDIKPFQFTYSIDDDEERAKKYVKDRSPFQFTYSVGDDEQYAKDVEQAYLDGLRDGRNEQRKLFSKNCVNCNKSKRKTIKELKAQIEKLKSDVVELQSHCIEVDNVNAKMKNCGNCKHCRKHCCDTCDENLCAWELKE